MKLEETCCHSNSSEKPSVNAGVKNVQMSEKILITIVMIFTNPSARAGYDTRSISKQSLTSLNSEFSFS